MFIDNDFPKLLGAELYRPHPAYVVEMACEPVVVHDFTKQPGQTVQLDRYRFFGNPGTKTSRERTQDQTIGTANSRSIVKDKVLVSLREYTGPADPNNTSLPSTFKIARETLMTAQRLLLDTGNLNMFHQSIGSLTLLDDYRRWRDRVFLDELFKSESRGQSSDSQGGYYYPNDHSKTGATVAAYTATEYASERFKFNVKTDLLNVVKSLRKRNVPVFQDGYYRCIADPSFMKDLRADQGFREVARYPGMGQPNPLMGMASPTLLCIRAVSTAKHNSWLVSLLCLQDSSSKVSASSSPPTSPTRPLPSTLAMATVLLAAPPLLVCSSVLRLLALVSVARMLRF